MSQRTDRAAIFAAIQPLPAMRDRFMNRRPPRIKGEVLIHGHTHQPRRRDGNQIHVGVDAWDYAPVPLAAIEALIREV